MNAPTLRTEARQVQGLTPRLQRAVRLLQLSSQDFVQEIRDSMVTNPFLELEEAGPDVVAPATFDPALSEAVPIAEADTLAPANDATMDTAMEAPPSAETDMAFERDSWQAGPGSTGGGSGDSDISAMELVAADIDLRQYLRSQIAMLPLDERDHALACTVIESLDDDGYLRTGLDELATLAALSPAVESCEMNTALKLVQSLEPAGVAARSVAECLLLQMPQIEDADERALAGRIVAQHLAQLAQRDIAGIAKALGEPPTRVHAACERIRHLDPRPGWRHGAENLNYVTPDVIVKKVRGTWAAALNHAVIPRVKLNQMYANLFQQHRGGGHGEMAAHLQDARWTVRNVQQRFSTILSVAQAILKRQHRFLDVGPLAMKPLGLREIADEVGIHESTVCRVTNNKYMATPVGVFELKYFFSRGMHTASGGSTSPTAVRGVIQGIIEAEDPKKPLSDAQIAKLLTRQGLTVARRTVTKYRQLLKVEPVERRKRAA